MLLQSLLSSFSSIQLTAWEEMLLKESQNGWHGGHLGYRNWTMLAFLNLQMAQMPPTKFGLNLTGLGSRCGFKIVKMAAWAASWIAKQNDLSSSESLWILMLPIKFQFNPTYRLGGDVVGRISRWLPWLSFWISELNNCSNSESLSHSDASDRVFAQADLRFGRRCGLKNFKMAPILDIGMERF